MYIYINKLGSRSYNYIHSKNSHICVINLVLERCCFEALLLKRRLCPLKVNIVQAHTDFWIVFEALLVDKANLTLF